MIDIQPATQLASDGLIPDGLWNHLKSPKIVQRWLISADSSRSIIFFWSHQRIYCFPLSFFKFTSDFRKGKNTSLCSIYRFINHFSYWIKVAWNSHENPCLSNGLWQAPGHLVWLTAATASTVIPCPKTARRSRTTLSLLGESVDWYMDLNWDIVNWC